MSNPVTDNALTAAWPGSGLPKTAQSRIAQGRKTRPATIATTATIRTRAARSRPGMRHATIAQARPIQTASFLVSAASPIRTPSQMRRGSKVRVARGSRAILGMSRHAARARAANGMVESGRAEWSSSGR